MLAADPILQVRVLLPGLGVLEADCAPEVALHAWMGALSAEHALLADSWSGLVPLLPPGRFVGVRL